MPTYAQLQTAIANARSRGDNELADQIEQTYLGGAVPSPTTAMGGAGAALAQGATLGLYDELLGAVAGSEAAESQREQLAAFRREAPGAALGAEMAGAIPAGLGIGAGVGSMARAPGIVGRLGRLMSSPTIGGQATLGGIEGAVAGAAGGEEPSERLAGGLVGAGLGAVTGGAASRLAGPITRRLAPQQRAETMLRRELESGGITPGQYPELARRAGAEPQRTLAELGGPTTEMQAVVAHSVGGKARDIGGCRFTHRLLRVLDYRGGAPIHPDWVQLPPQPPCASSRSCSGRRPCRPPRSPKGMPGSCRVARALGP